MFRIFCSFFCLFVLLLPVATSCGPRRPEEFKDEGEALGRLLLKELRVIQTKEQLAAASLRLETLFSELADLMIGAEETWKQAAPALPEGGDPELNEALRLELSRLYRLDEGRKLIEKSQEPALEKLREFRNRQARLRKAR